MPRRPRKVRIVIPLKSTINGEAEQVQHVSISCTIQPSGDPRIWGSSSHSKTSSLFWQEKTLWSLSGCIEDGLDKVMGATVR